MGRPAKPLKLHIIEGTARPERMKKRIAEMVVEGKPIGDPPEWLGAVGQTEWRRLTEHETYRQVLNPIHYGTILEYCILFDRMINWETGKESVKFTGTERQMLQSLRIQLGITPASAAKVKMPERQVSNSFSDL